MKVWPFFQKLLCMAAACTLGGLAARGAASTRMASGRIQSIDAEGVIARVGSQYYRVSRDRLRHPERLHPGMLVPVEIGRATPLTMR